MAAISEKKPVESAPMRRGWWRRNWKRLVGGLMLVVLLGAGGAWYHLFGRMMFSEPFKMAWAAVKDNKHVIAELGEPIGGGWMPHGTIDNGSNFGKATINFTISGPKGSGEVAAVANYVDGSWGFAAFDLTTKPREGEEAGKRLNLMADVNAGKPSDTPTFNPKDASKNTVTTKEATPDQNINIDLDTPPSGK